MNRFCSRLLLALLAGALSLGLCSAQADDADKVKEKLFEAKKTYDADVQKYKKTVLDFLDKREETARAAGDKKAVDHLKTERDAFNKDGALPSMLPAAAKQQMTTARTNLDKAYATAVKGYLVLKEDALADATEKERLDILKSQGVLVGKPVVSGSKEELQKLLAESGVEWGGVATLKADGTMEHKDWRGLVVKWIVVDRRTVVCWVEKGRGQDRTAIITFNEDLTEFEGFGFNGERFSGKKRKP